MCEPCNVLQSGPRFDFLQLFFSFSEPMQVVIAPAVQFPMDLCSASAIQPISFLFCCKSKLFNSKRKLQISNPRFPLLLFTLSNTQTHKLHYRSTSSQDPLQSSSAVDLAKLHASLLVVQDVHSTWPRFAKETFRSRPTSQASCSQTKSLPKEMPQPS